MSAGNPVWIDINFPDPAAGEEFYTSLFGWTFEDQGPTMGDYRMIHAPGGHVIAGASPGIPQDASVPTEWMVHLGVDDLEAALTRVSAAGGKTLSEPMPVGELGTVAVVSTPSGAALGLWQAASFTGFTLPQTHGTPVWFEHMSTDFDADLAFYAAVFGWENALMEGGFGYATNWPAETATAGLCDAANILPAGTQPFWRIYFQVKDTEESMHRVTDLGGTVLDGPMDSPFGRLCTVADPYGHAFQIISRPAED
ncbi:VOC family protein [Zhihengliuella flava]|uniref:Enzyme related to lactoylglutathione lyase n=1 Tax=Zhihengliuella flava TaxID=1285193 RepID=A0A931D8Y3_9MICC|nr:VOC family protein [Zhihengliuella flava]MBG6084607.1 putative enzyme related to lactoylglutathione lyase [Zhihengliuella flava]